MKNKIKKQLKELADKNYQQFHGKLCPGTEGILGVRVPVLRNYAKELLKEYHYQDILAQIEDEYYEETMLQGMIIGLAKDDFQTIAKYIKEFVPKIDNWAICDTFVAGLKIVEKNKKQYLQLINNFENGKPFERRFLIVSLLNFYMEEEYLDESFKRIDRMLKEEYYVQMAIAWYISMTYIKYPKQTLQYIQKNHLDNFIQNKAIQKIRESYRVNESDKEKLLKYKR